MSQLRFEVREARRQRRPLKIGLEALSGGGKTYTAVRLAKAMIRAGIGKRMVLGDSENESGSLYEGEVVDGERWEYQTIPLYAEAQSPDGYRQFYEFAVAQGFDVIIVDSMTHAWKGALARVDDLGARARGDKFGAGWRVVTPEQERMVQTITDLRAHLITTTRVKGEYERTEENGKKTIKKMGTRADQREGMEYEYDVVVRLEPEENFAVVEKVRGCTAMKDRAGPTPGPDFWKPLFDWWLSAPEAESPEEQAVKRFAAAATVKDLAGVWTSLPDWVKVKVEVEKDRRKGELAGAPAP
jgi:hypothetical protein